MALDLSSPPAGLYFIKVIVDGKATAMKYIKQ
jgi:hypothetical protein